jgi:hypothetical protein
MLRWLMRDETRVSVLWLTACGSLTYPGTLLVGKMLRVRHCMVWAPRQTSAVVTVVNSKKYSGGLPVRCHALIFSSKHGRSIILPSPAEKYPSRHRALFLGSSRSFEPRSFSLRRLPALFRVVSLTLDPYPAQPPQCLSDRSTRGGPVHRVLRA